MSISFDQSVEIGLVSLSVSRLVSDQMKSLSSDTSLNQSKLYRYNRYQEESKFIREGA